MILLLKPREQIIAPAPRLGDVIELPDPAFSRGRVLLVFVRHTGCPFAERDIKESRRWAAEHPDARVVVVTHGDINVRNRWLDLIGGGDGLALYHDSDRHFYGQIGLGYSNGWHFMGPQSLMGVVKLWFRGIFNRMASGTRWQRAGVFFLQDGVLQWSNTPQSADDFILPPASLLATEGLATKALTSEQENHNAPG